MKEYRSRCEEEQLILLQVQESLRVWRGVKEVGRDGDVDLVDDVALGGDVYSQGQNPWS